MANTLILALLTQSQAQQAVDNLVEAEFSESDMSLIMTDPSSARTVIDDAGPLKGVIAATLIDALTKLSVDNPSDIAHKVTRDTGLFALSCDTNAASSAIEILQGAGAVMVPTT